MVFPITLYSTETRNLVSFVPRETGLVRIYSCGPTVYWKQHLGNLRYVFFVDVLKVVLREIGDYEVLHVMNITDVWHLTDDGDQGEDKMEKGAAREGLSVWDIAKKYEQIFCDDLTALHIEPFTVMPRATEHIAEQIALVADLEKKWYTYLIPEDGVYCDTARMPDYGRLLPPGHLAGINQGERVDASAKKSATDFALWKFSPRDQKRQMERDSPWWIGFPGRHIECSAMSLKHLGPHIDIHTWGVEHIPVHHTNEIVQSEYTFCDHPWVQVWFHLQHLLIDGIKISKSIGNVAFLSEVFEKGYNAYELRYFFLQAHYRNFQDFTWEQLQQAADARRALIKKISRHPFGEHAADRTPGPLYTEIAQALANDLDTVTVLQLIHRGVNWETQDILDVLAIDGAVLRLGLMQGVELLATRSEVTAPAEVVAIAQQRYAAKQSKDFASADALRKQMTDAWRTVIDTPTGRTLEKI